MSSIRNETGLSSQTKLEEAHDELVGSLERTYLPALDTAILKRGDVARIVGAVEQGLLTRGLLNVDRVLEPSEKQETPDV